MQHKSDGLTQCMRSDDLDAYLSDHPVSPSPTFDAAPAPGVILDESLSNSIDLSSLQGKAAADIINLLNIRGQLFVGQ